MLCETESTQVHIVLFLGPFFIYVVKTYPFNMCETKVKHWFVAEIMEQFLSQKVHSNVKGERFQFLWGINTGEVLKFLT